MKRYLMMVLFSVSIFAVSFIAGKYHIQRVQLKDDIIQKEEMSREGMAAELKSQSEDIFEIVIGGDVLLDKSVGHIIDSQGYDSIWGDVKSILTSADLAMVNLECPLSSRGTAEKGKQFLFRGKPGYVNALKSTGIDIVALANNHIMDFGEVALLDTMKHLGDAGILYAGAGLNEESASMPVYIDKGIASVAVLSSSRVIPFGHWRAGKGKPGVASAYDPARLLTEVKTASEKADIVLVYLHWGEELKVKPVPYQKELARMLIDAGADLVVGSHPHVLQELEYYKGKLIAYSLGNLVFTNSLRETMLLRVKFAKLEMPEAEIIPCIIRNSKVMLAGKRHIGTGFLPHNSMYGF